MSGWGWGNAHLVLGVSAPIRRSCKPHDLGARCVDWRQAVIITTGLPLACWDQHGHTKAHAAHALWLPQPSSSPAARQPLARVTSCPVMDSAAAIPTFRLLLRFLFLPHIGLTSTVPLDWRSAYTLMPIKVCGGRLRFVQHEMCICLCLYRSTELDTAAATSEHCMYVTLQGLPPCYRTDTTTQTAISLSVRADPSSPASHTHLSLL